MGCETNGLEVNCAVEVDLVKFPFVEGELIETDSYTPDEFTETLEEKEGRVYVMMLEGLSQYEIGLELGVTRPTAQYYVNKVRMLHKKWEEEE